MFSLCIGGYDWSLRCAMGDAIEGLSIPQAEQTRPGDRLAYVNI